MGDFNFSLYVPLILNILFVVTLLIGFFIGYFRGLSKSAMRIGFVLLGAVLAIFISYPVTNAALNFNISSIGFLKIEGNVNLFEWVTDLIGVSGFMNSSSVLTGIVKALPVILVNVFVFVVVFALINLVGYILYLIFSAIFIEGGRKKEMANRKAKDEANGVYLNYYKKKPRSRGDKLLGGLMGIVQTALLAVLFLVPVNGYFNMYSTLKETEILEQLGVENTEDIFNSIDSYKKTAYYYLGKITFSDQIWFDATTNVRVENEKIYLRKEVNNIAEIAKDVVSLDIIGNSEIDLKNLDLDAIERIGNNVVNSAFVKLLAPELVKYYHEDFINGIDFLHDSGKDILNNYLSTYKSENLKQDFGAVIGLVKQFKAMGLFDIMDTLDLENFSFNSDILSKFSLTNTEAIANQMISSETFKKLIIAGVNEGLYFLNDNPTLITEASVNWNTFKSNFALVLNRALTNVIVKDIIDGNVLSEQGTLGVNFDFLLRNDTPEYQNNFRQLGSVIDSIKNDTVMGVVYTELVNYLKANETASKFIDFSILDTDADFSWTDELDSIKKVAIAFNESGILDSVLNGEVEDILDLLNGVPEQNIRNILEAVSESKLLSKVIEDMLNDFVDTLNNESSLAIGRISITDLAGQIDDVIRVINALMPIMNDLTSGSIDINTIDINALGELLNALQANYKKGGLFSGLYGGIRDYIIGDSSEFGQNIADIFGDNTDGEIDWVSLLNLAKIIKNNDFENITGEQLGLILELIGDNDEFRDKVIDTIVDSLGDSTLAGEIKTELKNILDSLDFTDADDRQDFVDLFESKDSFIDAVQNSQITQADIDLILDSKIVVMTLLGTSTHEILIDLSGAENEALRDYTIAKIDNMTLTELQKNTLKDYFNI